jgi:hypothetical protein
VTADYGQIRETWIFPRKIKGIIKTKRRNSKNSRDGCTGK